MKKTVFRRVSALLLSLCLLLGGVSFAEPTADLEALYPLMDLVCAAGYDHTIGTSLVVPDSEGVLEITFVDNLIRLGQARGVLGITGETMADPAAQTALLQSIFAAQLPQTEVVVAADVGTQYIGFKPVTVNNTGDAGSLQIVGEMYMAPGQLDQLSVADFSQVLMIDRAIFTFKADPSAMNGFRLMGFSTGLELSVEEQMQAYSESIVVEYVNTNLGFMVLYPSFFVDDMLVEDANGVSAALPDDSASFFARRSENTSSAGLSDVVAAAAAQQPGAVTDVNEELCYGTVSYITGDYAVFDVYVVTAEYVYQAQLRYLTSLMSEYNMYNTYMLNSFGVDGLAAG